jgi:hypothetical protein
MLCPWISLQKNAHGKRESKVLPVFSWAPPQYLFLSFHLQMAHAFTAAVESSWNVMAHGDAREGKWIGNWRMEWVASTLYTTSEHGVSSITTADAQTSAASSRLNWRPRRFKWTRPFRGKTESGFCACAIRFQAQYIKLTWMSSFTLLQHYP